MRQPYAIGISVVICCSAWPVHADPRAEICNVLHAIPETEGEPVSITVYETEKDLLAYLENSDPSWYPNFGKQLTSRLQLSGAEFDDLRASARGHKFDGFEPACGWAKYEQESRKEFVDFTKPLFSRDGRLAIVAISWQWRRPHPPVGDIGGGHGAICAVRQTAGKWIALCVPSWIS